MQATVETKHITYELANLLVQAAIARAKELNLAISVAIVDPAGELVAFGKMDYCCLIGIGTAQGKAYTAARSGLNIRAFLVYLQENKIDLASLQAENLVLIAGGLPIFYKNTLIGGIGVGGATGVQDEDCAQVALNLLV